MWSTASCDPLEALLVVQLMMWFLGFTFRVTTSVQSVRVDCVGLCLHTHTRAHTYTHTHTHTRAHTHKQIRAMFAQAQMFLLIPILLHIQHGLTDRWVVQNFFQRGKGCWCQWYLIVL